MANITKRIGKNGALSYRIRAYAGTAADGRQIVRSMTFTPPAGMSARQAEKEAKRQAVEFEQRVQRGIVLDAKFTLDELLDKWFQEFARPQLKPQTVYGYQNLRVRISAALGHMKIDSIRPAHLMAFYDNLAESGMRMDVKFTAAPALISAVEKMKRGDLAKAAGVSSDTVRIALRGDRVSRASAEKLAAAAGLPLTKAFKAQDQDGKLAGDTIRHYHRLLSSVFSTAVKWQLLTENPCDRVAVPKAQTPDTQFLDESGIARLLEVLPEAPIQYSVLVQLALLTGCRRGELCALRWSDIDFKAATLSINRTLQSIPGQGPVFGPPKTKRSRRCLKISGDAVELLQEYRREQAQHRLKVGSVWAKTVNIEGKEVANDLLFTRWDGHPIDPGGVSSWFPVFLREHGLPPVRFHSLRHTNASLLIAAHVPVVTVSGRLGHAKTSTTTDIYAACIRSSDAAAADALDNVFTRIHEQVTGAG